VAPELVQTFWRTDEDVELAGIRTPDSSARNIVTVLTATASNLITRLTENNRYLSLDEFLTFLEGSLSHFQ
jgi:hypothetical protein